MGRFVCTILRTVRIALFVLYCGLVRLGFSYKTVVFIFVQLYILIIVSTTCPALSMTRATTNCEARGRGGGTRSERNMSVYMYFAYYI